MSVQLSIAFEVAVSQQLLDDCCICNSLAPNSQSLNARLILAWNVLVGFCTALQIIELNRLQDDAAAVERSVNQTRPDSALAFRCQVSI